jgi:hypothetical protein
MNEIKLSKMRGFRKSAAICISTLLLISTFAFLVLNAVSAADAPTFSFGNSAIGTIADQNDANAQSISFFKCTTTGQITDIITYISGTSTGSARAALYAANGNSPSTLLAQSNPVNIGTTLTWVDFQLPSSYTATAGTTYGLAIMGNVPINLRVVAGTGQRTGGPGDNSYANGFTNPFGTVWFNDQTGAMSIYAAGTSSTPTSTPTPIPTSTPKPTSTATPTPTPTATPTQISSSPNLIPSANYWYPYEVSPAPCSVNVHLDNNVLFNGNPSIRIDQHTGADTNTGREADTNWHGVSPGQHIVFSCWIKTSGSSIGYNSAVGYGGRIGIDFYNSGYVTGISWAGAYTTQPTYQQVVNNFVNWNTGTWTLRTLDFIVPSTIYDVNGVAHTPTGIIPWIQVQLSNDAGSVWFADATLYITNS